MHKRSLRLACFVVAIAALFGVPSASAQLVTHVVDGDTIIVEGVGSVRLIGVDTAESSSETDYSCAGRSASAMRRSIQN